MKNLRGQGYVKYTKICCFWQYIKYNLSKNIQLTTTLWNGKQLTAEPNFILISSTLSLYLVRGKVGSWIANTFITTKPSCERALATLKNLVLPRLQHKNNKIKLLGTSKLTHNEI